MGSVRALACLVILAVPALAAPVPMQKVAEDETPRSAVKLLKHRKVQKELKLSAEQRIAIVDGLADIEEAIDKKRMSLIKLPNPNPDIFQKLEKEHQAASEKLLKTTVAKVLTPAQRTRLRQIDRHIRGPEAFTDPSTEKTLSLTDAQKQTIEKAAKRLEERTDSYIAKLGNDDSDNAKEELLKLRKELEKSLVAALTADQSEIWKSMLGEPVTGFDPIELWFAVLEEDDTPLP